MLRWFLGLGERIDRSFYRRLRRASGLDQPQHAVTMASPEHSVEEDGTEISNVALGTGVDTATAARPALADLRADLPPPPLIRPVPAQEAPAAQEEEEEGTITNL